MVPQHVIVATDFSEASGRAISIAGKLALQFGAKLSVLHVFEIVAHHRYQIPVSWMIDAVRRDIKQQLLGKVEELKAAGINAHACLLDHGIAPVEIIKYLDCHKDAVAVMGTHARSGMERFLLGSTAEEVLRHASCPVITVGPHVVVSPNSQAFRRVLYAVDCSQSSMSAVPLLQELCTTQSVEMIVLHVSTVPAFDRATEDAVFEPVRKAFTGEAAVGIQPEYVTLHGTDISQAIVNEAERLDADLIVLGVRRGDSSSLRLPPKITFQVIAAAPSAVLTVSSGTAASALPGPA